MNERTLFTAIPETAEELVRDTRASLQEAQRIFTYLVTETPESHAERLERYNDLMVEVDHMSALGGLLSHVHPDKELRETAERMEQELSKFLTDISLDKRLYAVFKEINVAALAPIEQRLITKILLDFHRSGVDKDDETRAKIIKLKEELVEIGQEFGRNIREDVRRIELDSVQELDGLPADFIAAHQPNPAGKIVITTDYPDYRPFMMYAHNAAARERLYREYMTRAYPKNASTLKRLVEKRHELAVALGYPDWAEYATEDKMIKHAGAVAEFIDTIAAIARPRAEREYAELLEEKRRIMPEAERVEGYESAYFEELVKRRKYAFDSQVVRPYFEYNRTKQGLLQLTSELFGIEYRTVAHPVVWHPAVEVYDVYRAEVLLGRIYLDMHPRDNKYNHAAQFTLRSGLENRQIPEGVLVCNFSDPSIPGVPALMDHDQVTTFFHEFGHLLHHVLGGHQRWLYFSGVATEWDFVEAPSQFFEEWAWDPEVLEKFTHHVETNQPITREIVEAMRTSDEFGQGLFTLRQMLLAAVSLNYYNQPPSFDPAELYLQLHGKYGIFPYMPGTHMETSFGHLDGYSAIYYTYMWSLVIAKDLLSRFKAEGMLNQQTARSYCATILEPGGSKDAADLVNDFLGRPYSFDAFRAWLDKTT